MASNEKSWTRPVLGLATVAAAASVVGLVRVHGNSPAEPARVPADAQAAVGALSDAFKSAAKSVAPSVVSITTLDRDGNSGSLANPQEPPGDSFRRFFEDFGFRAPPAPFRQQAMPFGPAQAQGTGIVVRENGYIVTNNHVVDGAEEIRVRLDDGREYPARVAGTDAESDLAVLKIEADALDPVELGDAEQLEVGEWVIAVGSPFGLEHTVTAGIVSAKGRSGMGLATYEDFIQTDAAINPGNSGGPLVDLHGRVVGVNTAISTSTGGFMGVGFAIPSGSVQHVVDNIIDTGHVTRGWLGAHIQPLNDDLARSFGLEHSEGVLVADTVAGGPAATAGLEPGDVVTQVGGRSVSKPAGLLRAVGEAAPGSTLRLQVMRGGSARSFDVTLGERPGPGGAQGERGPAAAPLDLGMTLQLITPELSRSLGVESDRGALVADVQPGGPAQQAGLRDGDIIMKVGDQEVSGPSAFWSALSRADLKAGVRLQVQRAGHKSFLFLKAGEA